MSHPIAGPLLEKVSGALDVLIDVSQQHHGLFPSMIGLQSHEMLVEMPDPIEGQRNTDRAYLGANLIHDQATLAIMYALSCTQNKPEYATAADRYLTRFASHCTDTPSGLFPWGEHSYWHLVEDRVGNSYADAAGMGHLPVTHDHLRQAPLWLWEKLNELNPQSVQRFADGLDNHFTEGTESEYIRHAYIMEANKRHRYGDKSNDFPRHSGFYIFDWAYAYSKSGRDELLQQIYVIMDHWWHERDERGLLLISSRLPENNEAFTTDHNAVAQTLSLAASLLEAADLLDSSQPELATTMRERAATYVDGFFAAPHDLSKNLYLISSTRSTNEPVRCASIWGSVYGHWPASYIAIIALCAYRHTNDERLLTWASAVGDAYLAEPLPADLTAPAMDAGIALEVLADLHDQTGDPKWLEGGLELAAKLQPIYFDHTLPRGAAGIDWYESQMGPCFLLHGMARLGLLEQDRENCPLGPDYTAR